MKKMKTKNKCLVTSLAIIAMLMMSVGVKAQNVTIGPDNGSIITGVAGGNSADSGMGRGMGSMWRHEQLALMMTTSDIANLTSGGELADPSNAIDVYDIDGDNGPEPKRLILGAGQTQTFVVVSLPKGYRITSYRLVLQPNISGNITLHPHNPDGTNNSWPIGTDDRLSFYETPAWSEGSPYGDNTHSTQLNCPDAIATATAADGSTEMRNNNAGNMAKEFVIERTSQSPDDMSNQLYFFFARASSQYAVSIKSFEIHFTAQGTFDAEVTPSTSGPAVSMVKFPFTTSKIDVGVLSKQTAHDNNNNEFQVYGYNYSNVRDLIAYSYLYQEDAVSTAGLPAEGVASNKHIYPLALNGKGAYAYGNGIYYVEPPVTITSGSGWEGPIGFRVVGAIFSCDWADKTSASNINVANVCKVSVEYNRQTYYLNDNLDFVQTTEANAFQWKMDEYGNLYTGDTYKHYLSCFGEGETRILSLSSSATGNDATWNLKIGNNNRLVYHSDGGNDYLLYYTRIQEGNDYHLRGYVSRNPNNNNLATAARSDYHQMSVPGFTPGSYTLVIYDEKGVEKERIPVTSSTANTDATKYTLTGLNNDALKFGIEGLGTDDDGDACQALVNITLQLEALNPYIDKMDIVCNDIPADPEQKEPNLEITQTFTADDFSVSGGKFIFYVPEDYAEEDLLFSFRGLYSKYGDDTYYDDEESMQMDGNARYSFVTSDYFKKVSGNQVTGITDFPKNDGLYDATYYKLNNIGSNGPDAGEGKYYPYTMKVNTSTAGTVRFRFNNADELGGSNTSNANLKEYPFTVTTYLSSYKDPDAEDQTTAATAEFKQCILNAKPNEDQHSGIFYVFTADETRYNIAPTTGMQHRFYAFYRMDIEVRAKTFSPAFTWKKIYDKSFYTKVVNGSETNAEDSMWGLILDVADTENGKKVQGYLTYQEIIDNILGREASGNLDAIVSKLDATNTNAPATMDQILYVDGTPLYAMLNSSQNSVVKKLEDLKKLLPANSLVILPENTKSLLDNVAFETTGESETRSFRAGKDIVLTDRQPFFSPYKIQVDAANKATYSRLQSGPTSYALVKHATVVLPFTLTVNNGKHVNQTDDGFEFNLRTLKALHEPTNNNYYYQGEGYFELFTGSQTKANQPYMVQVEQKKSDTYSFIATQYGATIEPTPTRTQDATVKGIGIKNFKSEIEQNIAINGGKLASYGTYSGAQVPKVNNIYYFNKDRFYCSSTLTGSDVVNVRPFRAYYSPSDVTALSKMTGFSILYDLFSDDGGITTSLTETSKPMVMTISTDKGSMLINAKENIQVNILSANGVNVNAFQMNAGEQKQVNVPSGIYIVNNTKILVK